MRHLLFPTLLLLLFTIFKPLEAQEYIIAEDLVLLPFDVTRWDTVDSTLLKVRYERTVNDPARKSGVRKEVFALQVGARVSKYYSHHINAMDEYDSGLSKEGMRMVWFDGTSIYQNLPSGRLTVVDREYFSPREESVANKYEEDISTFDWRFETDTMTVLGHLCHKAVTTFRGRTWEVWYASDIPMPVYPWKFNGLPGAILAFNDSEGIIRCVAIELLEVREPIKWFKWQYRDTTRDKQLEYMRKVHERPSLIMQGGEPTKQMFAPGQVGIANRPILYQPMEE